MSLTIVDLNIYFKVCIICNNMNGEEIKGNYGSVSFLNRKIKN